MFNIVLLALYVIGLIIIFRTVKSYKQVASAYKLLNKNYNVSDDILYDSRYVNVLEFYNIDINVYNTVRFYIVGIGILATLFNYINVGYIETSLLKLLIFAYIFTYPKQRICGIPTITSFLIKSLESRYKRDVDYEIHTLVSWLSMLSKSNSDSLKNPVAVLERMLESSNKTTNVIQVVIDRWNSGDVDKALEYFNSKLSTEYSRKLSSILSRLDSITVEDLSVQLDVLKALYRDEQFTDALVNEERASSLRYIPVMLCAFLVVLNFVFLVLFIPAIESLTNLF